MSDVDRKLRDVVVWECGGITASEIQPETTFVGDLHLDSLDVIELLVAVEDEFRITITDEEAEKALATYGELLALVQKKASTPAEADR